MPTRLLAALAAAAAVGAAPALALALAPSVVARAKPRPGPLVPVPGPEGLGDISGWHLPMAVDDRGRVGFVVQGAVGVIAAGARVAAVQPVPADFTPPDDGVALDRDGTVVAAGSFATGEIIPPDSGDPHASSCCDRPEVVRWRGPGHPLVTFPVPPDRHVDLDVGAFALDRAGTAYLVAAHAPDYDDPFDLAMVIDRDHHVVTRRLSVLEQDDAVTLLPAPVRAGAALLQVDGPRPVLLDGGADGWRARAIPARLRRLGFDLALGPGGRLWSVTRRAGVLWLTRRLGGRVREIAVGRLVGHRRRDGRYRELHALDAAMGPDGTVAVIWTRGDAVLLRTIAPDGRRGPERRLGRFRLGDEAGEARVAVDARGHAHALFTTTGRRVVAVGPRGRRVIGHAGGPRLLVSGIALSPGGAEALAVATPKRRLVSVTPAP